MSCARTGASSAAMLPEVSFQTFQADELVLEALMHAASMSRG